MEKRPRKTIFSKSEQRKIFEKAKNFVLNDLLPNSKINKILMFGSLVEGTFGKYEKPFKNRIFSDVDILIFVEDNFKIPSNWISYVNIATYKTLMKKFRKEICKKIPDFRKLFTVNGKFLHMTVMIFVKI